MSAKHSRMGLARSAKHTKKAGIVDRMRIVMTDGVVRSSLSKYTNVSTLLLVLDVDMSSLRRRTTG